MTTLIIRTILVIELVVLAAYVLCVIRKHTKQRYHLLSIANTYRNELIFSLKRLRSIYLYTKDWDPETYSNLTEFKVEMNMLQMQIETSVRHIDKEMDKYLFNKQPKQFKKGGHHGSMQEEQETPEVKEPDWTKITKAAGLTAVKFNDLGNKMEEAGKNVKSVGYTIKEVRGGFSSKLYYAGNTLERSSDILDAVRYTVPPPTPPGPCVINVVMQEDGKSLADLLKEHLQPSNGGTVLNDEDPDDLFKETHELFNKIGVQEIIDIVKEPCKTCHRADTDACPGLRECLKMNLSERDRDESYKDGSLPGVL